jgi:hypothetical protein
MRKIAIPILPGTGVQAIRGNGFLACAETLSAKMHIEAENAWVNIAFLSSYFAGLLTKVGFMFSTRQGHNGLAANQSQLQTNEIYGRTKLRLS